MGKIGLTKKQKRYGLLAMVIAGVYLFMRFLSPVLSPFILAFLFAGYMSKLTKKLPFKMKKPILAGILLLLFVIFCLIAAGFIGGLAVQKCKQIADSFPFYEAAICGLLGTCCDFMENSFGIDGNSVENYVIEQVNIFAENLEVEILPTVMNKSVTYIKNTAGDVGFLIVTIIAVFLILKDYDKILSCIKRNEDFKGILEILRKIVVYIKTYLKAQVVILLLIGTICAIVLTIVGIEGSIVYGIMTGFMDTLPFIGTGIMLMPVAFFQLIAGNYGNAAVIAGLYAGCALIRELLEPKLIGEKVGIWPVGILFSVFAGMKLFGIVGIIKGPVSLVIICETCKYLFAEKEENVKEDG